MTTQTKNKRNYAIINLHNGHINCEGFDSWNQAYSNGINDYEQITTVTQKENEKGYITKIKLEKLTRNTCYVK